MKKLYEFNLDCGRSGNLDGLFIADSMKVNEAIGREVYLGEALGKHSEVYFDLEDGHLTVKSEDLAFIKQLEDLLGEDISGYNPLSYIEEN